MPKIKLDDIEYNTEDLSEHGQATLQSLHVLEVQRQKLQSDLAVYPPAQRTYVAALKAEIQQSGIEPIASGEAAEE